MTTSTDAVESGERIGEADADRLVARSIRKYRRYYRRYERKHPEIFNPIEQRRLRSELAAALSQVRSGTSPRLALDLGCGSGNLTRHLLDLSAHVLAADVSPEFLKTVDRRYGSTGRVQTVRLNGRDLSEIADASVDIACAYSVLHHIPDYLGAIDEMCRVLAPGGVAYIDHEVNKNFWDKDGCFWELLRALDDMRVARANLWNRRNWWDPRSKRWQRLLMPSKYVLRLRQMINPAYPWDVEGDIHVWDHDHIEWEKIERRLEANGCEVIYRLDYLNYSSDYPDEIWQRFRDTCTNMRVVFARRPREPTCPIC